METSLHWIYDLLKDMKAMKMANADDMKKVATSEENNITRDKWIHIYSGRLLRHWLQQKTPFDIACAYTIQIKEDLADFYEDPLKRKFIEMTYC
ncbi:MAG: hypothetical protein JW837_02055 [Sedimentisphaerales bacterium]|nr:hypothetical protein [Sedimentisphaerales bacterium]